MTRNTSAIPKRFAILKIRMRRRESRSLARGIGPHSREPKEDEQSGERQHLDPQLRTAPLHPSQLLFHVVKNFCPLFQSFRGTSFAASRLPMTSQMQFQVRTTACSSTPFR
jgi:hypothetical protein